MDDAGEKWLLPPPTAWKMEYASGTPCDSFWMRCPWSGDNEADPARWTRFLAEHEEERVFTGVVDECQVSQDGNGCVLEVSGRGMAALLLDNEALGEDYGTATLEDILRDHVTPYGIERADRKNLPAVTQFSVATGSSEWSVLYDFARYHGGVTPRFDRMGRLVLEPPADDREVLVGDGIRVTELVCRDKRYGVLSEVLVRDRYSGKVHSVKNEAFCAAGGQTRRVLTMPGKSNYKAMRYTGEFQLQKSAAELERLELTVAEVFRVWPGDLVRISRSGWVRNGLFRAVQVTAGMDDKGYWSRLELAPPDVTI